VERGYSVVTPTNGAQAAVNVPTADKSPAEGQPATRTVIGHELHRPLDGGSSLPSSTEPASLQRADGAPQAFSVPQAASTPPKLAQQAGATPDASSEDSVRLPSWVESGDFAAMGSGEQVARWIPWAKPVVLTASAALVSFLAAAATIKAFQSEHTQERGGIHTRPSAPESAPESQDIRDVDAPTRAERTGQATRTEAADRERTTRAQVPEGTAGETTDVPHPDRTNQQTSEAPGRVLQPFQPAIRPQDGKEGSQESLAGFTDRQPEPRSTVQTKPKPVHKSHRQAHSARHPRPIQRTLEMPAQRRRAAKHAKRPNGSAKRVAPADPDGLMKPLFLGP